MEIIRVAASADGVTTRDFTRVKGFLLVAAAANVTASIFDADTQTGTAKLTMAALAATQEGVMFPGDVPFKNGVSVTLTGAGAILYVMVE